MLPRFNLAYAIAPSKPVKRPHQPTESTIWLRGVLRTEVAFVEGDLGLWAESMETPEPSIRLVFALLVVRADGPRPWPVAEEI